MRIPIPSLNEERRTELKKIMGGLAEKAKVSIRNIRREGNDKLKKDLKDKKISEDECKNSEKKIQNLTDDKIKELEKKLQDKEKEFGDFRHVLGHFKTDKIFSVQQLVCVCFLNFPVFFNVRLIFLSFFDNDVIQS